MKKYNLSNIMKRAWEMVKKAGFGISEALKKSWKEAKAMKEDIKNVVVKHFESYNPRRYSTPWVCLMTETGAYNFSEKIGMYTGDKGDEGDLVIFKPLKDQVYGYGQKDYRGNHTEKCCIKWDGEKFIECDKLGR